MEDQLTELLQFLHDRNPNVRQQALSHLLQYTSQSSEHRSIFFAGANSAQNTDAPAIRDLKLLCRDQMSIAHDAFVALINLADSPLSVQSFLEESFLQFVVSYTVSPKSKLRELGSMLLSNITKHEAVASFIVRIEIPMYLTPVPYLPLSRSATSIRTTDLPTEKPITRKALDLLLTAFDEGSGVEGVNEQSSKKSPLQFLGTMFANISILPEGRSFFVRPYKRTEHADWEYPLATLAGFTEHPDVIRRGGAVSTIKHCAFNTDCHLALLTPSLERVRVPPSTIDAPGLDILQNILLPLTGPEEFDDDDLDTLPGYLQLLPSSKQREQDPVLRLTLIETLILLCTTRWGRETLRSQGTYEVIKICHAQEEDDKVAEQIERLVNLLKRDEEPELVELGPSTEDDSEDSKIIDV